MLELEALFMLVNEYTVLYEFDHRFLKNWLPLPRKFAASASLVTTIII